MPTTEFDFNFNVIQIKGDELSNYELEIFKIRNDEIISDNPIKFTLQGVHVVDFIGENEQCSVIVSKSLIHQYIGNKKQHGKHYFYFYLKEDANWIKVDEHIWLDEMEINRIGEAHGEFSINPDKRINILSITNQTHS